ncbi:MAG: UDP-glucose/GDP-mannose dehydrogenase family protein [Bacteroidetes Order II. Incertae sedis bacterium]|nr:UDP-glucose/GDP-mannose dehydrogenase family protein [Bacteroidetes Order II. bacterium]
MKNQSVAVVGTGYVGLVTGTCFAEMGYSVLCVDIDEAKVAKMRKGIMPIFEPGLNVLFDRNRKNGRLQFTTDLKMAVEKSTFIFLALPTPPGADGAADLSYVLGVARQIGPFFNGYKLIINKSTVPVGTADMVREVIEQQGKRVGVDFDVVSNPEFLREGVAVDDFMKPERVVIGTSSSQAGEMMKQLYEPFVRNGNPILIMDERSSEMTKYAANAFLATKITFMNEIANLCEQVGANVDAIRVGIGSDSRIGKQFLYAGIGYGGSCFPKDVQALAQTSEQFGYRFKILEAVLNVNQQQQLALLPPMRSYLGGSLRGKCVAVWGLAFKANTDDVREASAHAMIRQLLAEGASVRAFDPEAIETTRAIFGNQIAYATDLYDALNGAEVLAICTEWNAFRKPDWETVKERLRFPAIFDGRNLYAPRQMEELGFFYHSIGRPYHKGV